MTATDGSWVYTNHHCKRVNDLGTDGALPEVLHQFLRCFRQLANHSHTTFNPFKRPFLSSTALGTGETAPKPPTPGISGLIQMVVPCEGTIRRAQVATGQHGEVVGQETNAVVLTRAALGGTCSWLWK